MKRNILYLCFCLVAYLLLSQTVFIPLCGEYYTYLIKPLGFVVLAILAHVILSGKRVKFPNRKKILEIIIIIVLSYIIFYYSTGLILGFTKSTYSTDLVGIFKNLYSILLVIILQEYIRYKILVYSNKKNKILIILIALIFTLTEISYVKIITELNSAGVVEFVLSELIPLICFNFLYCYIAINNSYKGSILFRGIPVLLQILIPIFPTWNWYLLGCFQVLYIFISYYIIKLNIDKFNEKKIKKEKKGIAGNIIFVIIIIVYIMFVNGVFRFVPVAVMSNSMYPLFQRGDVIVYEKVKPTDLEVGDVLVFRNDNKVVLHRINKITWKNEEIYIITKGDNLDTIDVQITTSKDIIGKMKFTVPAIGYPSVLLYEITK